MDVSLKVYRRAERKDFLRASKAKTSKQAEKTMLMWCLITLKPVLKQISFSADSIFQSILITHIFVYRKKCMYMLFLVLLSGPGLDQHSILLSVTVCFFILP